jgi:hypothetical protein
MFLNLLNFWPFFLFSSALYFNAIQLPETILYFLLNKFINFFFVSSKLFLLCLFFFIFLETLSFFFR